MQRNNRVFARWALVTILLACPAPAFAVAVQYQNTDGYNTTAVSVAHPLPVNAAVTVTNSVMSEYPDSATSITGNATGTTGAVVGTLASDVAKTTYICGFTVSAIGGTAAVGPITVAGLTGSSMKFQLSSTAAGTNFSQNFRPCVPASTTGTDITVTTTADGTATAVDVNAWGFRQ